VTNAIVEYGVPLKGSADKANNSHVNGGMRKIKFVLKIKKGSYQPIDGWKTTLFFNF
jgi:hypothetical protein